MDRTLSLFLDYPDDELLAARARIAATAPAPLDGFAAWWAARTYHVSQIPGLARKLRAVADWTIGLPFRRDTAEVGSIGHPKPLV